MPRILKHIDQIAREKQSDVLLIVFDHEIYPDFHYEKWAERTQLIEWFEKNNIAYTECFPVANEHSMVSYRGEIYIDVAYDENDPNYIKVKNHLENEEGQPRISGVLFYLLPLNIAMENQYHDEEGFWDKWAENF